MSVAKKKHHYLPQCYIKGFTDQPSGKVWVYNKQTDEFHEQGKNGTFHIRYFYRVDRSKYKKRPIEEVQKIRKVLDIQERDLVPIDDHPDMVEDLFSYSENLAAPIINKLIEGEKISDKERMELSTFIAFMYARTPNFRSRIEKFHKEDTNKKLSKIFSGKESLKRTLESMKKAGYKKEVDIDKLADFYEGQRYNIQIPREMSVRDMLLASYIVDGIFYNKTWIILRTPTSFITSDNPVFLGHSDSSLPEDTSMRIDDPNTKILFPLSKELLLIMETTPSGSIIIEQKIKKRMTRKMNKLIALQSGNYLIARDEALCKNFAGYSKMNSPKV